MPSTYAHYRLGQQVRRELEGNERKIIEKYPQLYLIGLHGPDILFYYKPLRSDMICMDIPEKNFLKEPKI